MPLIEQRYELKTTKLEWSPETFMIDCHVPEATHRYCAVLTTPCFFRQGVQQKWDLVVTLQLTIEVYRRRLGPMMERKGGFVCLDFFEPGNPVEWRITGQRLSESSARDYEMFDTPQQGLLYYMLKEHAHEIRQKFEYTTEPYSLLTAHESLWREHVPLLADLALSLDRKVKRCS